MGKTVTALKHICFWRGWGVPGACSDVNNKSAVLCLCFSNVDIRVHVSAVRVGKTKRTRVGTGMFRFFLLNVIVTLPQFDRCAVAAKIGGACLAEAEGDGGLAHMDDLTPNRVSPLVEEKSRLA